MCVTTLSMPGNGIWCRMRTMIQPSAISVGQIRHFGRIPVNHQMARKFFNISVLMVLLSATTICAARRNESMQITRRTLSIRFPSDLRNTVFCSMCALVTRLPLFYSTQVVPTRYFSMHRNPASFLTDGERH